MPFWLKSGLRVTLAFEAEGRAVGWTSCKCRHARPYSPGYCLLWEVWYWEPAQRFIMFPSEQTAMAWGTLTELKAFLSVSDQVLQALENKFGSFNDLITNVSTLPEEIWRD